jgi:hypothetical protein
MTARDRDVILILQALKKQTTIVYTTHGRLHDGEPWAELRVAFGQ